MKWISVKEKLPEDWDVVIIALKDKTLLCAYYIPRKNEGFQPIDEQETIFDKNPVTHWMPLPEPPKD